MVARRPWRVRRIWGLRDARTAVALAVLILIAALDACATQADDPHAPGWVRSLLHPSQADDQQIAQHIQTRLQQAKGRSASAPSAAVEKALARFYLERGFRPAWSVGGRPGKTVAALLAELKQADQHGLHPAEYELDRLAAARHDLVQIRDPAALEARLADLDLELSRSFLRFAGHLSAGRLDPRRLGLNWYAEDHRVDPATALAEVIASGSVKQGLAAIAPAHPDYVRLQEAWARYRELAAAALPPPDPASEPALRAQLVELGDLRGAGEPLAAGLRSFQLRHGLEPSGRLDKPTRAALAVPPAARARTLELNLERWRWLPAAIGERYLMVNIPAFGLQVVEYGRPVLAMKVVVGKTATQTPVMSDTMTTLVLNPYWNVPPGIATNEIWPEQAKDPTYLERHNMEVVTQDGVARIRQRPGPGNALGHYKFVFPNHLSVYLHDTPADELFERTERGFSHGCVRVERPVELADYVLRGNTEWPAERVADALATGREVHIPLTAPLPVYIVYFTAWVDADGRVHFRDDVYGHDQKLTAAFAERRPHPSGDTKIAARR